ncbi:single ig il-1-related receptor-like protein, partial [Lasius niger]
MKRGTINGGVVFHDEESGVYTGKPLPTYKPASKLVPLGGRARLYCEAYLGKVDLPDAKNSVTWSKSDSNMTLPSHGRIAQNRVSR